jgi:hypothetical protein
VAPFHRRRTIDEGILMTRALLGAIVATARAHGAEPLILVPSFTPEQPIETQIRERVLTGLPYIRVPLDPRWRIAGDRHPDARADLVMARAIVAELKRRRPDLFSGR